MRADVKRVVFTVTKTDSGWAVEHDGVYFGHSPDKDITLASAHRRALSMHDTGCACQVRVAGESGFF
jgi:hypothetical protein